MAYALCILQSKVARHDRVLAGATEAERAVARSALEVARASLQELEVLAEVNLEVARESMKAAEAGLAAFREGARRRVERSVQADVMSPVSGLVVDRFVEDGEEVQKGRYLMGVADDTQLKVHALLDESDFFKVQRGAPALVSLAGVPKRRLSGRVADVVAWPELDWWVRPRGDETVVRGGQLFQAIVALDEEPPLCIGMSAMVEIFAAPEGGADGGAAEDEETSSVGSIP